VADRIGKMSVYIGADLTGLARDLTRAGAMVGRFGASVTGRLAAAARPVVSLARDIGAVAGGSLLADGIRGAVAGVGGLVKDSVTLAAEFEKTAVAMEVLTGSAATARELMNDIKDFAAESPLGLAQAADQAKKLLAAGVGAGQVVPTVSRLSDLSVGDPETLNRLSYAYGQVRAAGRLYGTELRQFTETGIPLVEELGKVLKVPKEGVKALVEEGRVGFDHLQRAVKGLTDQGGKFYGMSERYANTFAGRLDKLSDGWDSLKRQLGEALIQEWGLKDATDDMGHFLGRLKEYVNDLRPTLKVIGDVGKGVFQVAGELPKVTALVGTAVSTIFSQRFPETIRSFKDGLTALQEFRLDGPGVARFGVAVAEGIADAIESVRPLWRSFVDDFVDPIKEAILDIGNLKTNTKNKINQVGDGVVAATTFGLSKDHTAELRANVAETRALQADVAKLRKEFGLDAAKAASLQFARAEAARFEKSLAAMESQAGPDETEYRRLKDAGRDAAVAERRLRELVLGIEETSQWLAAARDRVAAIEGPARARTQDLLKPLRDYRDELDRRENWSRATAAQAKAVDAAYPSAAAREFVKGVLAGEYQRITNPSLYARHDFQIEDQFPARLTELAVDLQKKFADPLKKLAADLADLDALKAAGRIDDRVYGRAAGDLLKDSAVGLSSQLAAGFEAGSQELASMVARASAGLTTNDVPALLERIRTLLDAQLAAARQIATNTGAPPAVVHAPE
jgi:tape measure domain-containing protein